ASGPRIAAASGQMPSPSWSPSMIGSISRREFLTRTAAGAAVFCAAPALTPAADSEPLFKISLAQWSLHRAFFGKKLDPLKFTAIAKGDYGIEAVEYVNQFYKDKKKDDAYLKD